MPADELRCIRCGFQSSPKPKREVSDSSGGKVKALRVAAYLLIAHFLITLALSFAARSGPDYMRIVLTLGFLIVALSALFNPRGKGWLAVVGYALYVLGYQVLGLLSTYAGSAAMPLGTKVVVAAVWLLINAMPVVALVLTLMPANFAAFKSSLANNEVTEHPSPKPDPTGAHIEKADAGKPAGISGSRTRALGWFAAVVTVMVVVAAILAVNAYRTVPSSQWMTSAQYQREFDTRARKGFYPHEVEGECQSDGEKFRADWKATPSGATFFAHHGMTRQDYDRRNQEYGSKGYSLGSVKHFKDCSGIDRYQATCLKR